MILGHNRLRSFRTPPAGDERRPFQVALFSCHMPYRVSGLFRKRTDVGDIDAWDFLAATLDRHRDDVDVVIAGGDQCYSDGAATLDIWKLLNRSMRREGGELLPNERSMRSWYRDIYRGYWGFEGVRRDIERDGYRILGEPQFRRFEAWAEALDPEETPFMFVVSAVPVLHARSALANADLAVPLRAAGLGDDLRDSWEHGLHDEEPGPDRGRRAVPLSHSVAKIRLF